MAARTPSGPNARPDHEPDRGDYVASGALPSRRSVLGSGWPWKYLSSSRSNTDPAGDTRANRVAQDLSFRSSGGPKTSDADRPSTPSAASAHSTRRGPRTGWLRYARASARLLIAYRWEVGLNPRPSYCGKTYHIQCDRLRPLRISASARA